MKTLRNRLDAQASLAAVSCVALALAFACSDDDNGGDTEPDGGDGGSPGSGGMTASGGSSSGGASSGGSSGSGGAGGTGGSGTGGDDAGADPDGSTDGAVEEFGEISRVSDRILTGVNDLRGLVYNSDGTKIYASGHTDVNAADRQLAVVRLNADGTFDTTFSGDGIVEINAAVDGDEQSMGIVELENGDIIVQANVSDGNGGAAIPDLGGGADAVREHGQNVVLFRFDDTGAPVTSFGDNGRAEIVFGWTEADNATWPVPTFDSQLTGDAQWSNSGFPEDTSWGIALDTSDSTQERIVVFGYGPAAKVGAGTQRLDNDRYVVRVLASTGAVDPAFNGGAPYTANIPGDFDDNARRGLVEADGTIVSAGYTNLGDGLGNHVVLIRLQPNGTPDTSFGFDITLPGATQFNPYVDDGGFAEVYAVGQQSSGRYVTTGYGQATGDNMMSQYGYATSTAQDVVSFGVLSDGLDTTYGIQGNVAIQSEEANLGDTQDRGRDIVVLSDDRVVHVGRFGPNPAIFVTTPDGALDISTGDSLNGIFAYTPFATSTSHFYAVALSPDGTRIAATTNHHADGVIVALLEVEE